MNDDKQVMKIENFDQDTAVYTTIGALLGAGVGALFGLMAANPNARKKIFSSYSDMKNKSVEIYHDFQKLQKEREKHSKARLIDTT